MPRRRPGEPWLAASPDARLDVSKYRAPLRGFPAVRYVLGHIAGSFPADMAIVGDSSGTVLLLEDEASLREPLAHLLRLRRYNVIEVDTVDAALAAIRTERPDPRSSIFTSRTTPGATSSCACRRGRR